MFSRQKILAGVIVAVCLVIVPGTYSGSAQAQSTARVVRPRMLIGERDPLTGFTALRARYAAGARPSDDIAGWALTYLLNNDESFAKRAVQEMDKTHPPALVGSRTYPEYVKWSLAFDWLYTTQALTINLKTASRLSSSKPPNR